MDKGGSDAWLVWICCITPLDRSLSFISLPIYQASWAGRLLEKYAMTNLTKMQTIMHLSFPP